MNKETDFADETLLQAKLLYRKYGKVSTTLLMYKLKISSEKAKQLMEYFYDE